MPPQSAASDPDAARLAEGWREHRAGRVDRALACYREVTTRAPGNADAWCLAGIGLHDTGRMLEAVDAYREALHIAPDTPRTLSNLANTLRALGRVDESLDALERAIRLDPGYAAAYENLGASLHAAGRLDEAAAAFRRALELDPTRSGAHQSLGLVSLLAGDWAAGWRHYEWRWRAGAQPATGLPGPEWGGESLDGKTLLLIAEQGIGDTVQFVRFAGRLRARYRCRVLFRGPPRLFPLLASAGGVDGWVEPDAVCPAFDFRVALASVPGRIGLRAGNVGPGTAYLSADPARVRRWRERLAANGPGLRVGIVWQGSPANRADLERSAPLIRFGALTRLAGVRLYALQAGVGREQLDGLRGWLPITDLAPHLDDRDGAFVDTAAAVSALDLLVTVDTAAAHVGGALGVPTWLALAHVPDWRWGMHGDVSPWYDSVRLFRQPARGDWETVFDDIAIEMESVFPGVSRHPPGAHRLAASGHSHVVRARHGWLLANPNDRYIGRSILRYGEYSDAEVRLLASLLAPGAVVVEGGANVGSHTIGLARRVGAAGVVHAFEPQRLAHQALCAAVAMNGFTHVHAHRAGLGAAPGTARVADLDPASAANFGGVELGRTGDATVAVTTVDALRLTRCDLILADVEGMELDLVRGAADTIERCRPLLYLECDREGRRGELFAHLVALGYRLYDHRPPLYDARNFYGNEENEFGRTLSLNALAVPSERAMTPAGLARIEARRDS